MIIFLYGPDDYRRENRKREIMAEYEKKYSGRNLRRFDFSENEPPKKELLDDFRLFARSQSIFEEKKLAVLEGLFELEDKDIKREVEPLLGDKTTTALISERNKPRKALEFLTKKSFKAEKFEELAGAELSQFIGQEAKKHGLSFAANAKLLLAEVYKGNTWGLVTEMEKLSNLGKKIISKKDLGGLGLETVPNYWATINSLKNYNAAARLSALERLFSTQEPPPKVFNILASLWKEKKPVMAGLDFEIKSGKLEYEEALLELVL